MFGIFKKKEYKVDQKPKKIAPQEDFNDVTLVSEYFKNETGVTFDNQIGILKSKLTSFCRLRKIYSFKQLISKVKDNSTIKQELIDYLTTNETFFYREFSQIKQLVEKVKEKQEKQVTILCAPSATGEESYSITIALLEAGVLSSKFSILGIDINSEALKKAEAAIYKERNIRNLSPSVLSKYFKKEGDLYILNASVKSHVKFKHANLFDASFKSLGKFDFVFSRNMLIYFDEETKIKAKKILADMLKNKDDEVFFGHADLF